ncbi:MAG: DUF2156 domain-containing protein [Clostridiales bacterium]|nr:DUF2156 domain-containing protein [Clostridiales bacterium]
MFIFDNRISIESRPILDEYLGGFKYRTSGLSFTSLYMWKNINNFSWQIIGDYLCISGISHLELDEKEYFLFPPLTKTGSYEKESLRKTILEAKSIFEKKGEKFSIRLVPSHMLEILEMAFPGQWEFINDRPNHDYLYMAEDLIELKGRKYSSKRNHLNYFKQNFEYEYTHLTSDMADEILEFISEFNVKKDIPDYEMELLQMEEDAIKDVLPDLEKAGYYTGAITIDGKLQAFIIGGQSGGDTAIVHVEKANTQYRGLYQAINNEFCKHLPSNIKYINREEDMDIPGLRTSKQSYRPYKMIEKYIAIFKQDL